MNKDKIKLNQMSFYGFHGLFPEENKLGQRFIVNLELYLSLKKAGQSDDMNESIDYGKAFSVVQQVVEGEARKLIEAVAETIAQKLLHQFPQLHACMVEVVKPDPPIQGHYDAVAVQIFRERET